MSFDLRLLRYPQRFTELCNMLLVKEVPGATPVEGKGGDEGIDCYTGNSIDHPNTAYQYKYFPERVASTQRKQIRESLKKVAERTPKKWVLLLPTEFTPNELRWFERLRKEYPGIELEYWGSTRISILLTKHDDVRQGFFPDKVLEKIENLSKRIVNQMKPEVSTSADDVEELLEIKTRRLAEIDEIDMRVGEILLSVEGDPQRANEHFLRLYERGKMENNETAQLNGIVGMVRVQTTNPKPSIEYLELCDHGIELSKKLKNNHLLAILTASKGILIYALVQNKIVDTSVIKEVYTRTGNLFAVYNHLADVDKRIQDAFANVQGLFRDAEKIMLAERDPNGLASILLSRAFVYGHLAFLTRSFFGEDPVPYVKASEKIYDLADKIYSYTRPENLASSYANRARMYWSVGEVERAKDYAHKAIEIGAKHNQKAVIQSSNNLLENLDRGILPKTLTEMEKEVAKRPITFEQVQRVILESARMQGVDLEKNDDISKAVKIGLKDLNPERVLKFCENHEVEMMNISMVAQLLGLPSLGMKKISCKHAKTSVQGVDLDGAFEAFKAENCVGCKYHSPRLPDWKWSLDWERKHGSKYFLKFFGEDKQ